MQRPSIVVRDGCLGVNPDSDELRGALFDLLIPEKQNGLPGADRGFGAAVHLPLVTTDITDGSVGALAIPIYQWMATSELLKYCTKKQWHHPAVCPKKYPRGLSKAAIALGELWKTVWELLHYWSQSGQTLIVFEELTREVGGLLMPYAWKRDDVAVLPWMIGPDGLMQVYNPWYVARKDRRCQEECDRYIRRAAALLRDRQNPYVEGSQSQWFVQWLIEKETAQADDHLKRLAEALTGVAKEWRGTTAIHRDLRFKASKGKGKALLEWRDSRVALWEEVSKQGFESFLRHP